jgi:polar amino acid transport system substrate-binding protein
MIDSDYPDGEALGMKINEVLKKIIKNGKYTQILEKYYGKGNVPQDWFVELDAYRSNYQRMSSFE